MISDWLRDAANSTGESLRPMPITDVDIVVGKIRTQYGGSTALDTDLWKSFVNEVSIRREDGWKIACEYPTEMPIVLYSDLSSYHACRIESTSALAKLLAESPGFEFYLTNEKVDFVLCFNHHDYLIGVGNCRTWLATIPEDR